MSSGCRNTQAITDSSSSRPGAVERLFTILNRGDRFNLADDPTVHPGNLDNCIHPIFQNAQFLGRSKHFKQALQLASLYLTTPSLLDFYLPLTFGSWHKDDGKLYQTYFRSDEVSRELELHVMQDLMKCISHSLVWEWKEFDEGRKWGSTEYNENYVSDHTDECPVQAQDTKKHFFKTNTGCKISLNHGILDFYLNEETGYVSRSRCEQFRQDFQLALVMGHEIAHAYGAMCHGNLKEPWLSQDHPRNELGYAWENFVFGTLIDPVDRHPSGDYIHAHKTWQSREVRSKYDSCELTAIPVAWTAQWFRTDTWANIELYGHRAVGLPDPTLKVYLSRWNRHVVFTDDEDAWADLERARYSASLSFLFAKGSLDAVAMEAVSGAVWMPMIDLAKESLMATPQRHFEDKLMSDKKYLRNVKDRKRAVWRAQEVAERKLARTKITSVAAGPIRSHKHTGGLGPVRVSKKLSVAAGPMSSSSSDSSPVSSRAKRPRDADHHDLFIPSKKTRRGH